MTIIVLLLNPNKDRLRVLLNISAQETVLSDALRDIGPVHGIAASTSISYADSAGYIASSTLTHANSRPVLLKMLKDSGATSKLTPFSINIRAANMGN